MTLPKSDIYNNLKIKKEKRKNISRLSLFD